MPACSVSPGGPTLTRRRLLVAVSGAALGATMLGCSADGAPDPSPPPTPTPTQTPDPDARRRAATVQSAVRLTAVYEATIAAHPGLESLLAPLLADHRAHTAAVAPAPTPAATEPGTQRPNEPGSPSLAPTTSRTARSATPGATTPSVPGDPTAARIELGDLESRASDAARGDAVTSVDPELARLLAAVAASRAVHAALLDPAQLPGTA